ncbi:MAG: hypothetical protein QF768_23810, partial [Candidatus Latescibacteria bacterium]|nr:hypothetical protein [Candidatus Latescibacterota bacterium]
SVEAIEKVQRTYRILNHVALMMGLGLIAMAILSRGEELLGWDTGSVLAFYFLFQFLPLILATSEGFT